MTVPLLMRPGNQPGPGPSLPAMDLPRLLTGQGHGSATSLERHRAAHGDLPACRTGAERAAVFGQVAASGLTGRGGGRFPTARKIEAVARSGRTALVIANGTEAEPASAKDQVLLACQPHLVLDGAVLAARLVGASEAVIVAHAAVRDIVADAVAERRRARLDDVRLRVVTAAPKFTGGEATAVAHWVHSAVPTPLPVPPRLAERGPDGRPTLVHNVETLAHLALIGRRGAGWFRTVGTCAEPGSMLVTVCGAVRSPGVAEIGIGTVLGDVLHRAGGPLAPPVAFLVGGYSGSWVPASAAELPFSAVGLAPLRAAPGAGLIAALPAGACGLAKTARIAGYLAAESAGQCGPCVFGLPAVASQTADLAAGRPCDLAVLRRRLAQLDGRGGCAHPSGFVRLIRSALRVFAEDVAAHQAGWCSAHQPTRGGSW
jgi:NADH:ubiquinone oxidoreductase subunit F (NADH-binding)